MSDSHEHTDPAERRSSPDNEGPRRRWLIFIPLLAFFAGAPFYLFHESPKPFFLRWIDLCVGFFLALGACFVLKKLFIDQDDDHPDDEPDQDGRT
jgi:hypothetical protein